MNSDTVIVDLQGFKDSKNKFILKEFAILYENHTQIYLVKPPYSFNYLSKEEKRQVRWIENNRGIRWSEGFVDYRECLRLLSTYLDGKKIITKGLEKIKWISELCSHCEVIDIGEKGCPNISKLYQDCKQNISHCGHHNKICALKNVLCIKKWYDDNNMSQFSLFDNRLITFID